MDDLLGVRLESGLREAWWPQRMDDTLRMRPRVDRRATLKRRLCAASRCRTRSLSAPICSKSLGTSDPQEAQGRFIDTVWGLPDGRYAKRSGARSA